jgi:hypothetical protein
MVVFDVENIGHVDHSVVSLNVAVRMDPVV